MQTYQASEAKAKFLRILDDVEAGQTVVITRHGKPVARIGPESTSEKAKIADAIDRMRALRRSIGTLTLEEILSARDEGRR